jgi:hypothetical protein
MTKTKTSQPELTSKKTIPTELVKVLKEANRPGAFVCQASAAPVLPGLEIPGIGAVGFPLSDYQAEAIRNLCEQAPYGKGEQTLVDTSIRRVWQLMPDKFSLNNPEWHEALRKIVETAGEELGLGNQQLEAQLYNLLLYEKGSFFLPHRDGEKIDRMVATLVLVLPGVFQGGELIVRHDGQEIIIDFGAKKDCAYKTHFAAFYADCEHEVAPLKAGFRLCLVYNLVLKEAKGPVTAPRNTMLIEKSTKLLKNWVAGTDRAILPKLVFKLDHRYTKHGLAWDSLKGLDRAKAFILKEAASKAGCVANLAELTYWEQGYGEQLDYRQHRRYRQGNSATTADSIYEMNEIYETSLTAKLCTNSETTKTPFAELEISEDEVVPPGGLTDIKPEEQFEGYMGNYGDTLDRWYRHAAIIIWPQNQHFNIICQMGTRTAISELKRMVQDLPAAAPDQLPALKTRCLELDHKTINGWHLKPDNLAWQLTEEEEEEDYYDLEDEDFEEDEDEDENANSDEDEIATAAKIATDNDDSAGGDNDGYTSFLACLELLGDTTATREFLQVVLPKDKSVQLTTSFLNHCGKLGLAHLKKEFELIGHSTNSETLKRNIGLFELLCSPECYPSNEFRKLRASFAQEIVTALKGIDSQKDDWLLSTQLIDRSQILLDLTKLLITTEEWNSLASLVSYTLVTPHRYHPQIITKLLCQLTEWLPQNCKNSCAVKDWLNYTIGFLKNETASEPQAPRDFRREAKISCRCEYCQQLIKFLQSPTQTVHRFKVRKELRGHLHTTIESERCDVSHVTERIGSPQTLVCTKNTNSYQRALKQYNIDKENLEVVQSLEKQLQKLWKTQKK